MCGIFAFLGKRRALRMLVKALEQLEYRGYDSAGVGILKDGSINVVKKQGKVANMAAAALPEEETRLDGTVGIAHTRWATHGKPSDVNSHPHLSRNSKVAVVHNGIIENFEELRAQLKTKGYNAVSETDTEMLAHLCEEVWRELEAAGSQPSKVEIVQTALSMVHGTFGAVFMFSDEPDMLVGARRGSPLILGIVDPTAGQEGAEYVLASDAAAIVEHTKHVVYLEEDDLVEVRRSGFVIHHALGKTLQGKPRKVVELSISMDEIKKGEYKHFMLKEIMDQPRALGAVLRGRLYHPDPSAEPAEPLSPLSRASLVEAPAATVCTDKWGVKLGGLTKVDKSGRSALDRLARAPRLVLCACGTSWHACVLARYLFEQIARLPAEAEYASEFRYRNPVLDPEDVVIVVSQSGETADTLAAAALARERGCTVLGVVNVVGSSIGRFTDAGVYLHAGPEIGVASTKAFTAQVTALLLMALQAGLHRHRLGLEAGVSEEEFDEVCTQLNDLPALLTRTLEATHAPVRALSGHFRMASNFLFLGRGFNFPVALEGALKLKEISYIHAEGYPAAEMKHGPIALIDKLMPVVFIAPSSDPVYPKIKSNVEEVKARNGTLLVVTEEGNCDFDSAAEFVIKVPKVHRFLEPLLTIVPLQLLSYYVADLRGCEIDQPRNLAKSVTVE